MYPFSLQFRAVGRTSATCPVAAPATVASFLAGVQNAIRASREAVSVLTAAADTITAALGQVRYYAATIDSVLDEMTNAVAAIDNFLETGNRLGSDIGGMFMASATALTEEILESADKNTDFPEEVRQSLYSATDSYDRMRAQASLQADSSQQERKTRARENAVSETSNASSESASTTGSSTSMNAGNVTNRRFSSWEGWVSYVIRSGDTLVNIAARELGDGSRWYEIATQNSLKAPYISLSNLPGTVHVGDTIMIPAAQSAKKTRTASVSDSTHPDDLYGRDIKLYETTGSRPGRTQVDIRIDPRTGTDIATIVGVPNLVQACQLKLWVEQGTHMLDPSFGVPLVVGYPNTSATVMAVRSAVRGGLSRDSRISRITKMIVVAEDDMLDVETTVVPVGSDQPVTIGVSVI